MTVCFVSLANKRNRHIRGWRYGSCCGIGLFHLCRWDVQSMPSDTLPACHVPPRLLELIFIPVRVRAPSRQKRLRIRQLHGDRFDCTTKIQCQRLFLNGVDGIVRLRTRAPQGSFPAGLFCEVLPLSSKTSIMAFLCKQGRS